MQGMSSLTFDKLVYFQRLKDSGVPEEQARAQTEALDEALRETVATKHDLEILKRDILMGVGVMLIGLGTFLASIGYFK
jgi:hypothetical protein